MVQRGIFRARGEKHSKEFQSSARKILFKATSIGALLGLLAAISIAFTGGNQINLNGQMVSGPTGGLIVVLACASSGFVIGLIGWLLMRALGEAAKGKNGR